MDTLKDTGGDGFEAADPGARFVRDLLGCIGTQQPAALRRWQTSKPCPTHVPLRTLPCSSRRRSGFPRRSARLHEGPAQPRSLP